jgi:alkylhydroperoxidase family enzyme
MHDERGAEKADGREGLSPDAEPRLAPLEVSQLTEDLRQILTRMFEVNAALESRERAELAAMMTALTGAPSADQSAALAKLPEIVRTMLRHPQLFVRITDVGIQLLGQGALSARDRELAILRIGWLCRAPYEWGEHVLVAKRIGITGAEIERVTQGSQAEGWTPHEQAILRAAEELHKDAMISDATWAVLAKRLDERQLIELPVLIGQYQAVAYYQNALRLRLHDGNPGLSAR